MRIHPRLSVAASAAAVTGLVATAVTGVALFANSATAADAPDQQPTLEETFEYPGAAKIFADRGIKLIKGDGHITFVECSVGGDLLRVESHDWVGDKGYFCFSLRGTKGYVTLELPSVYLIRGDNSHTTAAKVTQDEVVKTEEVEPGEWQDIGVTPDDPRGATLLELRISG